MTELDESEKQVTDETRELLLFLDEKQKELTEYQTNIVHIEKYASTYDGNFWYSAMGIVV
jgi:hypothetical protein